MATTSNAFAEVIESSLQHFLAQSWQWDACAPFGSLVGVKAGNRTLCGIVYQVSTGSMEPNRYPFAYQKTEEELRAEQPHIFSFLKTTFSCLLVGYHEKGKMHYTIAPEPPKIHAFVAPLAADLQKEFFFRQGYLHLLFQQAAQLMNVDEILLALIKQQQQLKILNKQNLHAFIEQFSLLSGNDYRRLKCFLQRVQSVIETV